jgi:hypothetical protein
MRNSRHDSQITLSLTVDGDRDFSGANSKPKSERASTEPIGGVMVPGAVGLGGHQLECGLDVGIGTGEGFGCGGLASGHQTAKEHTQTDESNESY